MRNKFMLSLFVIVISINTNAQGGTLVANIYFSNQPLTTNHDNSKTSFASNEFIYGRFELTGGTMKDVFKIKENAKKEPCYLLYEATVFRNGNQMGNSNSWRYCLLKQDDQKNSWYNFDVLPEPSKATTTLSGIDNFTAGLAGAPLYHIINREHFNEEGEYKIMVEIYTKTLDAWGNQEAMDKWPVARGEFSFNFKLADIPLLQKNNKEAEAVVSNKFNTYDKLPDVFSHSATINDPEANNAKIATILKRDWPGITILKIAVEQDGSPLWMIEKNDRGIILRKRFYRVIYVAYKKNGKCFVTPVQLIATYKGGGSYGTLTTDSSPNEGDRSIDCSKVK